jgi:hypothetical protein
MCDYESVCVIMKVYIEVDFKYIVCEMLRAVVDATQSSSGAVSSKKARSSMRPHYLSDISDVYSKTQRQCRIAQFALYNTVRRKCS